ncbi:hypothetical protein [Paenibacillus sp. GCM10027626]|uniref:hypothetical protein n=1 Tax=Paenibacillus sp. GCM10027626 TaxID=3273411 RepID=UPI0036370226
MRWSACFTLLIGCIALSACTAKGAGTAGEQPVFEEPCTAEEVIDDVSALQWNGVHYRADISSDTSSLQKGREIGQVSKKRLDQVKSGDDMNDGDATLLEAGTKLYEVQGYKPEARLLTGDGKLFVACNNPDAKTINELLDIEGKVVAVRFISGRDSSPLSEFTPEKIPVFAEQYANLSYSSYDDLAQAYKHLEGTNYSLEIELQDRALIRLSYNPRHHVMIPGGAVSEEMDALLTEQRALIYN